MITKPLLVIFSLFFLSLQAMPLLDATVSFKKLQTEFVPTIFPDSENKNIFYLPYTRLAIMPTQWDSTIPNFAFSYSPDGAMLSFTLKAVVDLPKLKPYMEQIKQEHPLAIFKTLPIYSGRYLPTLQDQAGMMTYLNDASQEIGIAQNFPQRETSFSFFFARTIADLMVSALQGNASIGINYAYTFKARATPSTAKITVVWKSIDRALAPYRIAQTHLATASIEKMVQHQLNSSGKEITIELTGEGQNIDLIQSKLTRLILEKCFVPAAQEGYKVRTAGCEKSTSQFNLTTESIETVTAQAGLQFGGLCLSHKNNFNFVGTNGDIVSGCPTQTYSTGEEILPIEVSPPLISSEIPEPIMP